jgi:hypothetical protein
MSSVTVTPAIRAGCRLVRHRDLTLANIVLRGPADPTCWSARSPRPGDQRLCMISCSGCPSRFYSILGFPIAHLADRANRRIIAVEVRSERYRVAIARGYWDLFLSRIGVGVGEATSTASHR